jgi:hypothetical protein
MGILRKFFAILPNGLSGVMQILASTVLSEVNGSKKATANSMIMTVVDFSSNFYQLVYQLQLVDKIIFYLFFAIAYMYALS